MSSYDADDIVHLEGLDAVRKRPGMYIGSTDSRGLTHLVWEILDNAVDEALGGFCDRIDVTLLRDGGVVVEDNGRGIPVGVNEKSGMSGVLLVMSKLHAGGKFGGSGYKSAGGLHGVGASVVNALSSRVDVTVKRDGGLFGLSFQRGTAGRFVGERFTPGGDVVRLGDSPAEVTGTRVEFHPDLGLFLPGSSVIVGDVFDRARQTTFLIPGLTITINDLTTNTSRSESYQFTGGVTDMVKWLQPDAAVCGPVVSRSTGVFVEAVPVLLPDGSSVVQDVEREVVVDVAFIYGTGYDNKVESFVNIVRTGNGGSHRKGFERGLLKSLSTAIGGVRGLLKPSDGPVVLDDVLEGLTAVISVNVPEPQFVGQTKDELGTVGVLKIVQTAVEKSVKTWVDDKTAKNDVRVVFDKVVAAGRVRVAQRAAKDVARRKSALSGGGLPSKLVDCRVNGVTGSELFIVEGDSALGSARGGRNSEFQALLPIRGKILNVQKATPKQVLDNVECSAIIQVLGAGSGRTFDIDQMRYDRIILMTDADVDGSHIRCLLLTLFARFMRPVIEHGRLYAAMPPLHKVTTKGRNPITVYTYTQEEMERKVAEFTRAGKQIVTPIPRFKGLGEMDAEELDVTTMSPVTRSVRKITLNDAVAAEGTLELLMGNSVEPRRDFIIANSGNVDTETLDS